MIPYSLKFINHITTKLPIEIEELREFLRLEDLDENDTILISLIKSSAQKFERYTGIVLMDQIMEIYYKNILYVELNLIIRPVQNIMKVESLNHSQVVTQLHSNMYWLHENSMHLHTIPNCNILKVTIKAGLASSSSELSSDIKTLILEDIAENYMNRGKFNKNNSFAKYDMFKMITLT